MSILRIGNRLIVTVPENPSDTFLGALQEEVLGIMDERVVGGVVLDIGAVGAVDSYLARTLAETGDMIRLMGGETVVSGMQPSVALTLTELGLTLGSVQMAMDLESALTLLDLDDERSR